MISGDLSCVWTKPFDVTREQVAEMQAKPAIWRPLGVQIKDHNDNRKKQCEAKK